MSYTVTEYSPLAVVVQGPKKYAKNIENKGGKFNDHLKNGMVGWIFPKSKLTEIRKMIEEFNSDKVKPMTFVQSMESSGISAEAMFAKAKDLAILNARLERIEKLMGLEALKLDTIKVYATGEKKEKETKEKKETKKKPVEKSDTEESDDESEETEDDDGMPVVAKKTSFLSNARKT